MPCKDVIRSYQSNCVYHIYNRGVEKRIIFLDNQDYQKFLYYLYVYAWPRAQVEAKYPYISERLLHNNLFGQVEILAFCLMPHHFHILLKINSCDAAIRLMK